METPELESWSDALKLENFLDDLSTDPETVLDYFAKDLEIGYWLGWRRSQGFHSEEYGTCCWTMIGQLNITNASS